MNWTAIKSKLLHAVIPAAGAALAMAVPLFGAVPLPVIAKTAAGAFLAYLLKPARPGTTTAPPPG